jgi:UDP-glucuronate 4-epimerase
MNKSILITGAAGFIGFHLAKSLQSRGDKVVGYDNFNPYYEPRLKRKRASELSKQGIEVIEGDICNFEQVQELVRSQEVTHLVNLAAQPGVRYSLVNPQAYVKANLEGFVSILEVCRHASIPLVYASSSSVYGANAAIPFTVEDRTDHQVSLYGATKKANELMAYTYHHLFGIATTGLRFFTVYGPWGRPDMAYFSFADAIMQGRPIELFNEGRMRRDFTYIDDIVAGTVAAIDLQAPYEIFNLGNHHPEEVVTLVALLEQYLGKKAEVVMRPMPPGDVPATYADIESSREKLGYEPKVSLQEGIKGFVDWYQDFVTPNISKG